MLRSLFAAQIYKHKTTLRTPGEARYCTSVTSALGRPRQEDPELEASLSYLTNPCFEQSTQTKIIVDFF